MKRKVSMTWRVIESEVPRPETHVFVLKGKYTLLNAQSTSSFNLFHSNGTMMHRVSRVVLQGLQIHHFV